MLSVKIDEVNCIAVLEPHGALSEDDFRAAAKEIDPFIERTGKLNGIVIHTKSFPGWDSFAALVSHFKFVKDHHKKLSRVAISTNSAIGALAGAVASHFVSAELKLFSYEEFEIAKDWVAGKLGE